MTNEAEHTISVIQDEERPYDFEVWCSCTRFGAVGLVHLSWYEYEGTTADGVWSKRFPDKQQAIDFVRDNHTPADEPEQGDLPW